MNKLKVTVLFLLLTSSLFCVSYVTKPGEVGALAGCSHLTKAEEKFAYYLSALHRDLFCKRFTDEQRVKAMSYATQMNGSNKEDQAVERVLEESRGQEEVPTDMQSYYSSPCYKKRQRSN